VSLQMTTWFSPICEVVRPSSSNYLDAYLREDVVTLHPPIKSGLVASSEVVDDVICLPLQVGHVVVGIETVEACGEKVSGGGGRVSGSVGGHVGGSRGWFVVMMRSRGAYC